MRFEREETDPYEEKRLRDESLDELADEDRALERLDRHGPMTFTCVNCGAQPKVPWCQLCGRGMAA